MIRNLIRGIFLLIIILILNPARPGLLTSANECIEGVHLKQPFQTCSCAKLGIPEHIALQCDGQRWITIPNIDKAFGETHKKVS